MAIDLTVTDHQGNEFHAVNEYGERLSDWQAGRLDRARYRRRFTVTVPAYAKSETVSAAIDAALAPHERCVDRYGSNNSGVRWGDTRGTFTAELISPSSAWCMECEHDTAPDEYGRTSPYAVYGTTPDGYSRTVGRNYSHHDAHEVAATARRNGWRSVSVGIDSCG